MISFGFIMGLFDLKPDIGLVVVAPPRCGRQPFYVIYEYNPFVRSKVLAL